MFLLKASTSVLRAVDGVREEDVLMHSDTAEELSDRIKIVRSGLTAPFAPSGYAEIELAKELNT